MLNAVSFTFLSQRSASSESPLEAPLVLDLI